jgi:hypothetical protein
MTRVLLSYLVLIVLGGPAMAGAFPKSIQCKTDSDEFSLTRNDKGYQLIKRERGDDGRIYRLEAQYAETDCKRVTEAEFPLVCGGSPSVKSGAEADAKPWPQRESKERFVTLFSRVYATASYGLEKADAADIRSYFALETGFPISRWSSTTNRSFDGKDCTIND